MKGRLSIVLPVVPLLLLLWLLRGSLVPLFLLDLLHLVGVFAERVAEFAPDFEGDGDRVAVGGFDFAHPHEHPVLVGAHVKKKALVVHSQ
ncbi:hypothetical protein XELAEV_18002161mg [Xenopus laevis]|uniref:Uncharacterized protein n=1 Tax=Xenopus laevis TaxID=8355 RepID=A0A974GYC8_XENLA|nr:hypothetical protein XELAEV_18002161mg [Xenopus laevis]